MFEKVQKARRQVESMVQPHEYANTQLYLRTSRFRSFLSHRISLCACRRSHILSVQAHLHVYTHVHIHMNLCSVCRPKQMHKSTHLRSQHATPTYRESLIGLIKGIGPCRCRRVFSYVSHSHARLGRHLLLAFTVPSENCRFPRCGNGTGREENRR